MRGKRIICKRWRKEVQPQDTSVSQQPSFIVIWTDHYCTEKYKEKSKTKTENFDPFKQNQYKPYNLKDFHCAILW